MNEGTFRDRHGVDVFWRRWPNAGAVGVVVIAHGASEHSGRYDRFARALNAADFAAYALDHRGHGLTAGVTGTGRMGAPGGDALVDDLDELVDLALDDHPGAPVVVFGHSMGSQIALAYATRHADRLAGVVLCAFPASIKDLALYQQMFDDAAVAEIREEPMEGQLALLNEAFQPARTPFDWLSRDEAEVDAYIADPWCGDDHPLTYGFVVDMFTLCSPAFAADALAGITCPAFVIAGDMDPAAGMGDNAAQLDAALREAGVTVEFRLYSGARHELLNETNRDEVTADVVAWVHTQMDR